MEDKVKCANCSSKEHGVFKCVGEATLNEVSSDKTFFQYKKKDVIFKENDKMSGFYCIQSGLVRTFKTSGSGKEQTFQIAGKGKWLGFRDIISGEESNHSSVCLEDVEVCFIPKETITKLIKSDEKFQIEVMKYLAEEWKEMENHVHSMGTKQIHSRLAELLITFHGASGSVNEVIIATNLDVEGEATATFIKQQLGTTVQKVTRLAHGLPMGADIEFADQITLREALAGRRNA
jgi:CRP/FNR family transcriptional regulator